LQGLAHNGGNIRNRNKYYIRNTIANLFRIVKAVVATVNQKRQLLVPVILNKFVIIDKV